MALTVVNLLLLTFLGLVLVTAAFFVWLQFRKEQYEERLVIDLILLTVVSALVGARIGWFFVHWGNFSFSWELLTQWGLRDLTVESATVGALVVVTLYLKKIDWPYLFSMDQLALGSLWFSLFFSFVLGIKNVSIDLYPLLSGYRSYTISAWWMFLLYAILLGVWFFLVRRAKQHGLLFLLFVASIPRIWLLLTALIGWLIITRKQIPRIAFWRFPKDNASGNE